MKKLYDAASALDAQILVDVLRQQHIQAAIEGQYLPGAIGELPANGLVRVMVAEQDWDAARQVVADWERSHFALEPHSAADATEVAEATDAVSDGSSDGVSPNRAAGDVSDTASSANAPVRKGGRFGFLSGLLFGGLIVGVMLLIYFRVPAGTATRDRNHDGKADEFTSYTQSGLLLHSETDRNFDGKIDEIIVFDKDGFVESIDTDDNFDGVFESHCFYSQGNVQRCETDTDGDSFADMKTYFKESVLTSVEHVERNSGLAFRVDYFQLGKMTHSELDTDKDGKLDTRITYDARLEVVKREAIRP